MATMSPDYDCPPPVAPITYGATAAVEFLRFIGRVNGTVVDIGTGDGAWAPMLRDVGAEHLIAVEPAEQSAAVAREQYDTVLQCRVEDLDPGVIESADLVILADCLEHLVDPWSVLRRLRSSVCPGTKLAVSVPNLQYVGILGPAFLSGRFEYCDGGGVMDRGHLRWFTHSSLEGALLSTGWHPQRWSGSCGQGKRAVFDRITHSRFAHLLHHQVYCLAQTD